MDRRFPAAMAAAALLVAAALLPTQGSAVHISVLEAAAGPPDVTVQAEHLRQSGRTGAAAALLGTTADAYAPDPWLRLALGSKAEQPGPLLPRLLPAVARADARAFLRESRQPGMAAVLGASDLPFARHLAARGAPAEAAGIVAGLLLQGNHLSPRFARELREVATAAAAGSRSAIDRVEEAWLGFLALARRLDWDALTALAIHLDSIADLADVRAVAGDREAFQAVLMAGLLNGRPGDAARHLARHPDAGGDLLAAGRLGRRSVELLLDRGAPVDHSPWRVLTAAAPLEAASFPAALCLKLALVAAGTVALVATLVPRGGASFGETWAAAFAATLVAGAVLTGSESHLGGPPSSALPSVSAAGVPAAELVPALLAETMSPTGIASVAFFIALQIAVFLLCLRKIREVAASGASAAVKLRLLENEDNLFDLGLYVGISGTALSLVLQVLGIVESNLLAAYSSNLLGIVGVAWVKIRHVRPYRRQLILEALGQDVEPPRAQL